MKRYPYYFLRVITLSIIYIVSIHFSWGQNKPFPQNINYKYGFKTTKIASGDITSYYTNWKSKYLIDCGSGNSRVQFDPSNNTTVSEGMGYGMVISAYMGDKDAFDRLWSFTKKNFNSDNLEGWKTTCEGFYNVYNNDGTLSNSGAVPATDGDEDIVFALLLADVQWGGYKTFAKDYIGRIKNKLYKKKNGRWLQLPGFEWNYENSSYLMPSYYRLFKDVTGDSFWDEVVADTYFQMNTNRNKTTGFISNEIDENGVSSPNSGFVDYNGARIPWRVVSDYLWNGSIDAQNICVTLVDWASSKGLSNVYDGYKTDGTPTGGWNQSPAWTGAWACGAMVKSQSTVDSFADYFKACTYDEYFASSLRLLYSLTLTGNAWKPDYSAPGGSTRSTFGNNGNPWSISSSVTTRIEAENFDIGGQGVAYYDTDIKNNGGKYRTSEEVDIEPCSEGGYDVGWVVAGEWLEYSVYLGTGGNYNIKLRTSRDPNNNSTIKILIDGTDKTGDLLVPSTQGWQTWKDVTVDKINIGPGSHTVRIFMSAGNFNLNWIEFSPSPTTSTRYEAENAILSGTDVATYYTGFSGSGYVDGLDSTGNKIDFPITVPSAGNYNLKITYSSCNDQQNYLKINGVNFESSTQFLGSACGAWRDKDLIVALKAGNNTITIEKNWGYMPVDFIEISPIDIPATSRTYGNNRSPWIISSSAATRIEAENFDTGGQGVAYNDGDAKNNGGKYRTTEGVDIETCSEGGFDVGWIITGEWLEYTIYAGTTGDYNLKLRTSRNSSSNSKVKILIDGIDNTGDIVVPSTSGWQLWKDVSANKINLSSGSHVLRIFMSGNNFNLNWIEFSPAIPPARYEAENAILTGTSVVTYYTGYSGTGYVDGLDSTGNKIDFPVTVASAGNYNLKISYAVCNDQNNFLKINGTTLGGASTTFPGTACGAWKDKSFIVSLNSGSNTITIEKDWGYTAIDYIEISPANSSARIASLESEEQPTLSFFPNPLTSNILTVRSTFGKGTGNIYLLNINGKVVFQEQIKSSETTLQLPSGLPKGVYLIKFVCDKITQTKRLIIE